jgi:hypothetical protein
MWNKRRPSGPRAVLSETPAGCEISVPVRREWWGIGFLPVWLAGWAVGWGAAFLGIVFGGSDAPRLFLIPWLIGWTGAGAMAFSWWMWLVSGREVVIIDGVRLRMRREVRWFARERQYELAAVSRLRFSPPVTPDANFAQAFPLLAFSGSLAFDAAGETRRFGMQIEEDEANELVRQIVERWPTLR